MLIFAKTQDKEIISINRKNANLKTAQIIRLTNKFYAGVILYIRKTTMNIPIKNFLLAGRIFLLASAFLFAGMLYFISDTMSFKSNSIETEGTIVGYTQKDASGSDGKNKTDYFPVIEYTDNRGNTHRLNTDTAMNYEVFVFMKAGESGFTNPLFKVPQVKIRYSRTNPEEARPARSFFDLWGTSFAYGILMLVFSILGSTLTYLADEERRRKE